MSLEEAKDPNTLPSRLVELADSKNQEIRKEVTKNPSTPLETLLRLAQNYPDELLENPALFLLFVQNPNVLYDELTPDIAEVLLDTLQLPSFIFESLALHPEPEVRSEVGSHSNTPLYCLETLAKDQDPYVREVVAENPSTPLSSLETLAKDQHSSVRMYVAQNLNTPGKSLEVLAKDMNQVVRQHAKNTLTKRKET